MRRSARSATDVAVGDGSDAALAAALRSRHSDTLRGSLASLEDLRAAYVEVTLTATEAATRAGQLLLMHSVNLLSRLEGVVAEVTVVIDPGEKSATDVPLLANVDPHYPQGAPSILAAAKAVAGLAKPRRFGAACASEEAKGPIVRLRIGEEPGDSGPVARAHVYASATDWIARVGRSPVPACDGLARLSFGAHAAAAVATAEVFRLLRATGGLRDGPELICLSLWSCALVKPDASDGPLGREFDGPTPNGIPPFTLAGAGAVGTAFLLTLWASALAVADAVIVDGDKVSKTNLNRYPLFGVQDVRLPKASTAADLLRREPGAAAGVFHARGVDSWWAAFRRTTTDPIHILISAVDSNAARHQVQDALPEVILGASTHELRAEVDRYYLGDSASRCLKCHNPVAEGEPDAVLRARLLTLTAEELRQEAEDRGVDSEVLRSYVEDLRSGGTGCGVLSGDTLDRLRRQPGDAAFAVSFVSALAGAMLAAQLVREGSAAGPALTPEKSRAHVQLWRPEAAVNGLRTTAPEPGCWCESPVVRGAYSDTWSRTGE